MASSVRDTATSVGLPAFSILIRLAPKGPLINFPLCCSGKRHAIILQFEDGRGGLPRHVVDGVLVAQPVGPLDGVVHVPAPVVRPHVTQGGIDTTLCGHSVGTGRE